MKTNNVLKTVSLGLLLVAGSVVLTHCTRQGDNLKALDRSLTATDSTVFAQFQDQTVIATADATPDVNDIIKGTGVATIIQNRCGAVSCHGGTVAPALKTFSEISALVTPGNPEGSKLWDLITTNNFNKAMPPVYAGELSTTEKVVIYNWIKNGAKEKPGLEDFKTPAIHLIVTGCASVNCHSEATIGGEWARKSMFAVAAGDTTNLTYTNMSTGNKTVYSVLKEPKLGQVWGAYKDSVKKFYTDPVANAGFRPFKTFTTPWTTASRRGPLGSYDDIIMDIWVPKNIRSNGAVQETVNGKQYYNKVDYLNSGDCFIRRIDSTLIYTNQRTGTNATKDGSMAYSDGNWSPSEIALVKAWYFADSNVPDVWKYGLNNQGMFTYRKSNNKIVKK